MLGWGVVVLAIYCKDTNGGGGVGLSVSNTTPVYTTLLCSALDFDNMYGIALYCKGTRVVVVVLWCGVVIF